MSLKKTFSKRDFSTGQYDRTYQSSTDEITTRGMVHSRNVLSSALGECKTRPGFLHRMDLDSKAVVIPYRYFEQDLALVLQDGTLDIFQDDGKETLTRFTATTPSTFTFPNTTSNNQDGVVLSDNSAGTTETLYKSFTAAWTALSAIQIPTQSNFLYFVSWDFGVDNEQAVSRFFTKIADNLTGAQQDFTKQYWNEAFLQWSDDGINWTTIQSDISLGFSRTQIADGSLRNISGVNVITRQYQKRRYWRLGVRLNTAILTNSNFYMSIVNMVVSSQVVSTTISSPYTASDLEGLKYAQNDNVLTICSERSLAPYEFKITSGTPSFTAFNHAIFDQYGFPKCVEYFQNRRWFGGFDAYPTRVMASRFGKHNDYTLAAADQITLAITADPIIAESNQLKSMIRNLFGGNNVLYCVSHDGISMIEAGNATVGVNQMNFLLKSDQRASNITPAVKDNVMFLVSEDREKIFVIDFDLITDKFVAPEITLFARDITVNKIKELHFIETRERMLYGSLDNGKGFALLYEKSSSRLGFFPIDTDGDIMDISSIRFVDNNYLYAVVNRANAWNFERLQQVPKFLSTDEFLQTIPEKNIATKKNLMDTFYFDSVRSMKNEVEEIWEYDRETQTLIPGSINNTNLNNFRDNPIRLFYGDDILDYYEVQIDEALGNNTYKVSVNNRDDALDQVFMRIQTPITQFQFIQPGDYYITIKNEAQSEPQVLLSKTTPGTFDLTIPANVLSIKVDYAGANGQWAWGTTATGSVGARVQRGFGAIRSNTFSVVPGDTISGVVGATGSVPTANVASVGGTGFHSGTNPQNDYGNIAGTWERGGAGGGSTGFVYATNTYEADGGGGASWAPPRDSGASNTGVGGKGGGLYGGAGGIGTAGVEGRVGHSATNPSQVGLQTTSGSDGYIIITGYLNVLIDTNFTLESETKLVPVGYFKDNEVLDPYVGMAMRFFPTESFTQYIDLNIISKDITDPENPFFVVEILRQVNLEYTAGMTFAIVRNAVEWNGTIQVVDTGRYLGTFTSQNGVITLDKPAYNIKYGFAYRKIGVIQDTQSYLRGKKWGAIALNVMDTMSLQIGARIDKMENVMKFKNDDYYDSSPIMQNGVLVGNVGDDFEKNKQLIFMTDEGLPFCIRAIETEGEIADRGAN